MTDTPTPTRAEMLARIHEERMALDDLLASLDDEQFLIPGVEPGWTVKDLLPHFAAWEKRMIEWITKAQRGEVPEVPMTDEAVDALNAATWARDKDLTLDNAWQRYHSTHEEAVRIAAETPDAVLFDAEHFAWREGRPLWFMVAANTYWHYAEHREHLEQWLAEQG